jgi:hypothetical protein
VRRGEKAKRGCGKEKVGVKGCGVAVTGKGDIEKVGRVCRECGLVSCRA